MHCEAFPIKVPRDESSAICTDLCLSSSSKSEAITRKWKRKSRRRRRRRSSRCWLSLYESPWKIAKVLTKSDVGRLNRLLFGADLLEQFMLPVLPAHAQRDAKTGTGTTVSVWDVDTFSMHTLVLKRWASFNTLVLIGSWNLDFVKRRSLKGGDQIGFLWDSSTQCFQFSLLKPLQH
ncbi:hypothetical protein Fmac_008119 [Flemingia macrophylla]|uniref:B3 domain-containing protein n=1 Tax=Flemingia macrophylla TaxID=520843 RepID=A0ABD1MWL2_9FABA